MLDPQRVAWQSLQLTAKKVGIKAAMEVRLTFPPVPARSSPVPPGSKASTDPPGVIVESTATFAGRTITAVERGDAATAATHEIVNIETGARQHRKIYRITPRGFLLDLFEPANAKETELPAQAWTQLTRTFTYYPTGLPPDAVITGPNALLYAASASSLAKGGDTLALYVLVKNQIEKVTLRLLAEEIAQLDYEAYARDGVSRVQGPVNVIRVALKSEPLDGEDGSSFRLFGLEGDIEILWDPVRRVPVEIAGQMKFLGRVEVRLVSATLR